MLAKREQGCVTVRVDDAVLVVFINMPVWERIR